MMSLTYLERRVQIETYFDRTAADAWKRLTSDAPVGRIRATVRAGRDEMRRQLLSWLPADLHGRRILDAGCGTGALATEAARRGANVVAIDLSPTLVDLARQRLSDTKLSGQVEFFSGDMLELARGRFDYVVAMDSLIHYRASDMVRTLGALSLHADRSFLFTYVPRTPALAVMHAVGRLFPRRDRAPAVEPIAGETVQRLLDEEPALLGWEAARTARVASAFYKSHAVELKRNPELGEVSR
jgi:magnesium-protoporphyrin O-methyltransferase